MKAGIVADIVVAIIILINVIVCTRLGFIRCVLQFFSTILALTLALLCATPLANFCDNQWGWCSGIDNWNIPFIGSHTLLKLMVGIAIFVIARLLCKLLDKFLKHLKEKMNAVNIVDRILGTVFGGLAALIELTLAFMLINNLGWTSTLSLTPEAGGFFACYLFEFCRNYMFDLLGHIFAIAAASTPKI